MNAQQRVLLVGAEVDKLFRWPRGRAVRMARRGLLGSVTLPDGSLRFKRDVVERIVNGADRPEPAGYPPRGG